MDEGAVFGNWIGGGVEQSRGRQLDWRGGGMEPWSATGLEGGWGGAEVGMSL